MISYYIKKSFKKLWEEGPIELLKSIIESSHWYRYNIGTKVKYQYNQFRFGDAAPDPSKIIEVPTKDIGYMQWPRFYFNELYGFDTYILDGDWDMKPGSRDNENRGIIQIEEYWRHKSIKSHFRDNVDWKNTELYDKYMNNDWEHSGEDEIMKKCRSIESLYCNIKKHGYMAQRELLNKDKMNYDDVAGEHGSISSFPKPEFHEICINIGRDGNLIFDDGRHRLSIAKTLNVEKLPVRVLVRHKKWQKIRVEVANADEKNELSEAAKDNLHHPDIRDLWGDDFHSSFG